MSFTNKLKDRLAAIKQATIEAGNEAKALIKIVPIEIKESRMETCNSCDLLFKPTMQCKECGCFVEAKTSFAAFSCPLKKWEAIE